MRGGFVCFARVLKGEVERIFATWLCFDSDVHRWHAQERDIVERFESLFRLMLS